MKISDFVIGQDFFTAIGQWRCTDIGTRTITAVMWPDPEFSPRESAQAAIWLAGPPYILSEKVFDERDISLAYRNFHEALDDRVNNSAHPGFSGDDMHKLLRKGSRGRDDFFSRNFRIPLIRHDRVRGQEVLHPYDWTPCDENVEGEILVLGLFTRSWASVPVSEWLSLPYSTPEAMKEIAALYPKV